MSRIIAARHQTANVNFPPRVKAEDIYNDILKDIELCARTEKRKAEIKLNTLQIRYQCTPSEEKSPITFWKKAWGPLIKSRDDKIELKFSYQVFAVNMPEPCFNLKPSQP